MSNQQPQQKLQQILIAYIGLAKAELSDEQFDRLDIPSLQRYVSLLAEALPFEYLLNPILSRHGIEKLISEHKAEEAVMHVFILYIFHKTAEGSSHPLERGIIRQQILGILPIFEGAVSKGLIRTDIYDKNADALSHIADSSGDVPEILEALSCEYLRLKDNF